MRNAVFTIVQDEPVFLPVWLRHYSKFFESENIHIINHQSTPENYDKLQALKDEYGFVEQNVFNDTAFDHEWLCKMIADYQHWLSHSYDCVLFCEADEIVTPKDGDLIGYIDNMERSCITTTGWEIVQRKKGEPTWNPDEPIIHVQRRFWTRHEKFNKPLLSRKPLEWIAGFHKAKHRMGEHYIDMKIPRDDDLLLIHLHRVDFNYAFSKAKINSQKEWAKKDIDEKMGAQNRIFERRHMESWYYRDSRFWEGIPKEYTGLI